MNKVWAPFVGALFLIQYELSYLTLTLGADLYEMYR